MANVLEKQTKEFIQANPYEVALQRWKKVKTEAGGARLDKSHQLLPQVGRLVFNNNRGNLSVRIIPDGRVVLEEATLVFEANADVQIGDTFEADGKTWIVSTVLRTIHESINATVGSRAS